MDNHDVWGVLSCINLYDCDIDKITDPEAIKEYVDKLCELISMKKYGDLILEKFGRDETEGYSFVQLIETSAISGHFANKSKRAFIDIFSCGYYDPSKAAHFTKEFFNAKSFHMSVIPRK